MSEDQYVWERNRLIPRAEKYANKKVGRKPHDENNGKWANNWNREFFGKMDRLARQAGLVK